MNKVEQKGIQTISELAKAVEKKASEQSKQQIAEVMPELDRIGLDSLSAENLRANLAPFMNGKNYGQYSTSLPNKQLERQRVWQERLERLERSGSQTESVASQVPQISLQDETIIKNFMQEITDFMKKHENEYIDGDVIMKVSEKLRSRKCTQEEALKILSDSCTQNTSNISNPVPIKEAIFYLRTT